jgi:alpha-galactosidase
VEVLKDYVLGDTITRYMQPGPGGPVGMMLFPAAMAGQIAEKSSAIDSLVQIKTVGDTYPGGSAGRSLRNGGTVATLTLESQREDKTDAGVTVVTLLRTHQGCLVEHHLRWQSGEAALDSFAVLRNEGPDTVTLELLSSFSLTGLTPFAGGDAPGDLILHRLRSAWSARGVWCLTTSRT